MVDHWLLADFLGSEAPPVGTLVHIIEEDEAELVWRRAADIRLRVSPAEYRCWVGLVSPRTQALLSYTTRGDKAHRHATLNSLEASLLNPKP